METGSGTRIGICACVCPRVRGALRCGSPGDLTRRTPRAGFLRTWALEAVSRPSPSTSAFKLATTDPVGEPEPAASEALFNVLMAFE